MTGQSISIGLSSWIIQDGNYGNFRIGMNAAFALEFYSDLGLKRVEDALKPQLSHKVGPEYGASGRIIYMADDWWVVDFGLPAFQEKRPPKCLAVGDCIQGDIYLGIDPFFYFERLALMPGAPPLIADWRVDRIKIQTAPFIRRGNVMMRDEALIGWRDIAETDAWNDDEGHADYVLTCTMSDCRLRHMR